MELNFVQNYESQRPWSDALTPQLLQLLANYFNYSVAAMRLSDQHEDIHDGFDVLLPDGRHVGLRVRKFNRLKYVHQFTLRAWRNQYGENEQDKVRAGKLDFMLYAFADQTGDGLHCWKLLDMSAVKSALLGDERFADVTVVVTVCDHCRFYAFNLDSFPAGSLIVTSSVTA